MAFHHRLGSSPQNPDGHVLSYTRDDIVAAARTFLGTPYQHQGRRPGVALDCLGIITCTADLLGHDDIEDVPDYRMNPDHERLLAECARQLVEIPVELMREGDIALFGFARRRIPQHFAILSSRSTMIHAHRDTGYVLESSIDTYWTERLVCAYRFPLVSD